MSKRAGKGLGIIAIIIATSAIGFAGYSTFFQTPQTTKLGRTWYNEAPLFVFTNPVSTLIPLAELTLTFNIEQGESVYFLYNSWSRITLSGTGMTSLYIYYAIDGYRLPSPHVRIADYFDGGSEIRNSVSLQYFNSTLLPGDHNVTIVIYGTDPSNGVSDNTLFVQTSFS